MCLCVYCVYYARGFIGTCVRACVHACRAVSFRPRATAARLPACLLRVSYCTTRAERGLKSDRACSVEVSGGDLLLGPGRGPARCGAARRGAARRGAVVLRPVERTRRKRIGVRVRVRISAYLYAPVPPPRVRAHVLVHTGVPGGRRCPARASAQVPPSRYRERSLADPPVHRRRASLLRAIAIA